MQHLFRRASVALLTSAPVVAMAQGTDPVVTAIEAFGARVTSYAAPVLTMVAIGAGIWLGVKYLKRAASRA